MDRILLYPVFLPLVVGFVLLFLPRRGELSFKLAALVVCLESVAGSS